MKLRRLLDFNWVLFAAMLALIGCGATAIWSAGHAREAIFHGMWINHLMSAGIGLAVYFLFAYLDYRDIVKFFSPAAYAASLAMLVLVLVVGETVYGGRRWLWFFQPSEVAKLCTIVFLSKLLARPGLREMAADGPGGDIPQDKYSPREDEIPVFVCACLTAGVPAVLILLEPDLGTTLALVPAVIVMIVAAGVWRKGLFTLLSVAAVAVSLLLGAIYEAEKPGQSEERRDAILKYVPMKPHQVKRVKTFLFPETDPMGAGYNLRQSLIAIGSGGVRGRGIGKGETNRLKYLPPSVSMNDFIFCVWAEETGYVGALALLGLFSALCTAGAWTSFRAADMEGRILALGATTLIFAHAYINMAMTVGLVPITGLPLPFMSSGRTFLIVSMAALGLVQSVSIHKKEIQ